MKPKSFLIAVLLITISIPAIYQIITPGLFPIHDDTQVVRVQQMYKALSAGQFPVRWVPDLGYGYGYPIFNFYNPLPYYFGALFMFLGLDALAAAKIMFIIPIIGSALGMYILAMTILRSDLAAARSDPSRMAAFLAAVLYVYAPYHAVQIYVRGAVAEYWAYAILPLVFYAVWKNKIILGGISLAALITSHNLTAFMSIPYLALALLFRYFETSKFAKLPTSERVSQTSPKNKWRKTAISLLIGLGLSAFFWIPAIFEANKTQVSQMVFEKFDPPALHLIKPFQLWAGLWGYGGSSPGIDDGLSLQLGKVHLVGSLAAIAILLYCYIAKKTTKQFLAKGQSAFGGNNFWPKANPPLAETIFLVIGLLVSIFMLLPLSQTIWNSFPILSYIQFPWRFLTFASLFSSLLAAWAIWKAIEVYETFINRQKFRKLLLYSLFSILCFLFIVSSFKFFQPQFKYPAPAEQLTSRERILWEVSGRSDEYLPKGFIPPATLDEALRVDNPINQALVDELKKPTPVRRIGNIISSMTIISIIGYTFLKRHSEAEGRRIPTGSFASLRMT